MSTHSIHVCYGKKSRSHGSFTHSGREEMSKTIIHMLPNSVCLPCHGTQCNIYIPVCPPPASKLVSELLRNGACALITFMNTIPRGRAGTWWLLSKYPSNKTLTLLCSNTLPPFCHETFPFFLVIQR